MSAAFLCLTSRNHSVWDTPSKDSVTSDNGRVRTPQGQLPPRYSCLYTHLNLWSQLAAIRLGCSSTVFWITLACVYSLLHLLNELCIFKCASIFLWKSGDLLIDFIHGYIVIGPYPALAWLSVLATCLLLSHTIHGSNAYCARLLTPLPFIHQAHARALVYKVTWS